MVSISRPASCASPGAQAGQSASSLGSPAASAPTSASFPPGPHAVGKPPHAFCRTPYGGRTMPGAKQASDPAAEPDLRLADHVQQLVVGVGAPAPGQPGDQLAA